MTDATDGNLLHIKITGGLKRVEILDLLGGPMLYTKETEIEEQWVGFTLATKDFQWVQPNWFLLGLHQAD